MKTRGIIEELIELTSVSLRCVIFGIIAIILFLGVVLLGYTLLGAMVLLALSYFNLADFTWMGALAIGIILLVFDIVT